MYEAFFNEGRMAALAQLPVTVCPYPMGEETRREWMRGYEQEIMDMVTAMVAYNALAIRENKHV